MSISLRANSTRRLCLDALLVTFAMLLSYLEAVLPLTAWIPLPGFRLGLANLAVVIAFCLISPIDAALISAVRVFAMGLLFGSATSLYFSALGALLSYLLLCLLSRTAKRLSFLGVSVLCAAAHNVGQIVAAVTLFGPSLIFSYLPLLLVSAILCGGAVGILLNLLIPRLSSFLEKRRMMR